MRTIMAGLAEFEGDLIRDRVKSGRLAVLRRVGTAVGVFTCGRREPRLAANLPGWLLRSLRACRPRLSVQPRRSPASGLRPALAGEGARKAPAASPELPTEVSWGSSRAGKPRRY
jgi:hypothetical protein